MWFQRPPCLYLCFSLQASCYLRLEVFKSWPRRAASSFAQYNTGCVVPYFLYAYESAFPVNLPKLSTHQWKILLPMQAGPDVTIGAANHTISALFARSFAQVLGRQPPAAVLANSTILLQDGSLGWKRRYYVFFPDSDLHILNHFKNALIIEGSRDDHRTKFPMVHRFHSREGCGARTLTSTLHLEWEETESGWL